MRIISWSVVLGSIAAILYGGVRPLLQDVRLPEINASQVAGTATRPAAKGSEPCASPAASADPAGKAAEQPSACDEPAPDSP